MLVWQEPPQPRLGMDTDEPVDEMTFLICGDEEIGFVEGDVMIEARVSDGNTSVAPTSWSTVKALLR